MTAQEYFDKARAKPDLFKALQSFLDVAAIFRVIPYENNMRAELAHKVYDKALNAWNGNDAKARNAKKILELVFSYLDFNPGRENPYHNNVHMISMCLRACTLYDALRGKDEEYPLEMLLACLFHDYGHTGKGPDIINISNAITSFLAFCKESPQSFTILKDTHLQTAVVSLIANTEFPFIRRPNENDLIAKIVCDVDMLQSVEVHYLATCYFGLMKEFGMVNIETFLRNQFDFMQAVKFHTDLTPEWCEKLNERKAELIVTLYGDAAEVMSARNNWL